VIIEETFRVDSSRPRVAQFLLDVPRMSRCVPGVEGLHRVDDSKYEATLVVGIGPIRAKFEGEVVIDDSEAPEVISAAARGRDSTTGSVAQVDFSAFLTETEEGSTEIRSRSDVAIRGRLGQFGTGVVTSTAREMIRSFAECAADAIGSSYDEARAPSPSPGVLAIVVRGVLAYLRQLWDRLLGRFRRQRNEGTP
jgi:hypothetical protein